MQFIEFFTPFLEIAIISLMINYLLSFFWKTKSMDLMIGFFAFLFILIASSYLHLPVLHKIMVLIGNVAVVAVLVIFQPELRVALSKLNLKNRKSRDIFEFDKYLDQLSSSVFRMADKRIGALIVMENEDNLDEYAQKAVLVNAQFSPELLETIFTINTPLHDGAVILRDRTLLASAVILPLADDQSQLSRSMGTRHRAGLGLSHATDALVIVVSEETGKVSIAREGIMTRGVKIDRFKGILRSIFHSPIHAQRSMKTQILEWLKR